MLNPSPELERIAHRGASKERTENTLPAFLLALEHGADAVELDVHATKDGTVVVHHDEAVAGELIADTSLAALQELDVGGGARVPTLKDVLTAVGTRATVYVELKGRGVADAAIEVVRRHGHRFAFHSFDHATMARVARKAPEIPRGVLLDEGTRQAAQQLRAVIAPVRPRDVWPHWSLIDRAFIEAARLADVRVIAWTVNSVATARALASLGVHGVCTDDVRMLMNL